MSYSFLLEFYLWEFFEVELLQRGFKFASASCLAFHQPRTPLNSLPEDRGWTGGMNSNCKTVWKLVCSYRFSGGNCVFLFTHIYGLDNHACLMFSNWSGFPPIFSFLCRVFLLVSVHCEDLGLYQSCLPVQLSKWTLKVFWLQGTLSR